jgi:hypothetical protein
VTWFDENELFGDVRGAMAGGIYNTQIVLVFITANYKTKVNSENQSDNCRYEFNYACNMNKIIIPVVMEHEMLVPLNWEGRLFGALGSTLYVNMTDTSDEGMEQAAKHLAATIRMSPGYVESIHVDASREHDHEDPEAKLLL